MKEVNILSDPASKHCANLTDGLHNSVNPLRMMCQNLSNDLFRLSSCNFLF